MGTLAGDYVELPQAAAPANPAANTWRLYFDSGNGNKLTAVDSAGNKTVYQSGAASMGMKTVAPGYNGALNAANVGLNYMQVRAAAGNAIYITGLCFECDNSAGNAGYINVTIGIGGAGVETAVGTIIITVPALDKLNIYVPLNAWIPVAAGTRIAVKTDGSFAAIITLDNIDQANVAAI
jgi:hypothetical protein